MITNATIVSKDTDPRLYNRDQQAQRGTTGFAMSGSSIKEFVRCPSRWKAGYKPPESEAKDWGSLLDCLVLEPERFQEHYAENPATYTNEKREVKDWNNNATVCRQWNEEQERSGKQIVKAKLVNEATWAKKQLMADEIIKAFIESSDKQVLVRAQWVDKATGITVPLRCLIDIAPRLDTEFAKCLGDLKSTRCAGTHAFQRQVFQMGYHVQAAFNTDMYVGATKEDRTTWCFIVQENFPPYQTGRRMLSESFVEIGRRQYRKALAAYCQCIARGVWPSYDDTPDAIQGWSLTEPDSWMEEVTGVYFEEPKEDDEPEMVEESFDLNV